MTLIILVNNNVIWGSVAEKNIHITYMAINELHDYVHGNFIPLMSSCPNNCHLKSEIAYIELYIRQLLYLNVAVI